MKPDSHFSLFLKLLPVLLLLICKPAQLFCQKGVPLYLSEHTKVSLLTSSPGEDLYAQFGHSAIRITDTLSGQDLVFNYGLFDFNTPGFYLKFIRGKLPYQLGIQRFDAFLNAYIEENRQCRELEINLDEKERLALIQFLSVNYLPENREYPYDFFFDNCATRIRDILENKFQANYPDTSLVKKASFRHFLAEYVGQNSWINVGFYLILGLPADAIATFRDEMFLPDYLEKHLENAFLGGQPLAKNKINILFQNQPQPSDSFLLSPILVSCLLFLMALILTIYYTKRWTKIFDTVFFSLISLSGILFVFMWVGTDHFVTHKNMNLLWANPLYILVILNLYLGKNGKYLLFLLITLNLTVLTGWKILPQEFHIAMIPLILTSILRLTDQLYYVGRGKYFFEK
ncbi:MAG: DUF4105 domain-containing protein [Saprospiraceae bacterium]|nr:DUF4105 domain-containing protein [Saprospiraceae bacterium]MDP4813502.1 DUF4105 domain-containing protein [Saprospiraceae bacterium]MDP5048453.1 DUF4105 domain-containing protein [Saprospiraceae bacterium]